MDKKFLDVLVNKSTTQKPLWMMRQAGRYLPEYRDLRAKAGDFLTLCYTPDYATEVTLQPIRRFHFDAAILFSDILVIPQALGQDLWFVTGEGPKLNPLQKAASVDALSVDRVIEHLQPVFTAIKQIDRELPSDVALVGFAGAPWTLATYMIEGGSSKDYAMTKRWLYEQPEAFFKLIDILVEAVSIFLIEQINAGATTVQIFDSWAGVLAYDDMMRVSLEPIAKIIANVKAVHPDTPVIAFPRGVGVAYSDFMALSGADGFGIDSMMPLDWAVEQASANNVVTQGNLDPMVLLAGGDLLDQRVKSILETTKDTAHVINLGHGILPPTPIAHVERLVELVRG